MYLATDRFAPLMITAVVGDVTLDDVGVMRSFSERTRSVERRLALADARYAKVPPAPVRAALRTMIDESEEDVQRGTLATAVIVDSPLLVAAMRGIYWLRPPVRPQQPFRNAALGLAWLQQQAAVEQQRIPEAALAMIAELDKRFVSGADVTGLFK